MNVHIVKWKKWLDIISHDVEGLLLSRRMFLTLQSAIQNNPDLHRPSYFYSYFQDTYISHVGISLRRQIKISDDSISFARLLREISDSPTLLSRDYFRTLYSNQMTDEDADADFDLAVGGKYNHIERANVIEDIAKLKGASETCESFLDRRLAHHDKRPPKSIPTFNQIHDAIGHLDSLCVKYHFLLKANSIDTLEPVHQNDCLDIFRIPWINS